MPTNSTETNAGSHVPIRPAASLLAVRAGRDGVEVMVLKRSSGMRFLPGFLSFPGGSVEQEDYAMADAQRLDRPLNHQHSDDAGYAVAAVRECAEEAGVTFALSGSGRDPKEVVLTQEEQENLLSGATTFEALLRQRNWNIYTPALRFVGRWITPADMPARFDTRFFITAAREANIPIRTHESESSWGRWCNPRALLRDIEARTAKAVPPTVAMLKGIAEFENVDDCFHHLTVPSPNPEELVRLREALKEI